MNLLETLKQARQVLQWHHNLSADPPKPVLIDNLTATIAELERAEPVAYMPDEFAPDYRKGVPLFTHPSPRRELTDEEILACKESWMGSLDSSYLKFARAILAAAEEK